MAEENVVESPVSSPVVTVAADSQKRKLDDLELNSAPEQITESDANLGGEYVSNGPKVEDNGAGDESERKRPRLETNGGNVDDVAEDSDPNRRDTTEETRVVVSEVPSQHHEPAGENGQAVDGQESVESVAPQVSSVDENEIGKIEVEFAVDLGNPKPEFEENSKEQSQEQDFPVSSTEKQPILDTDVMSHKMAVPNDKVGVLIGKAGDTIRSLQDNSGAKIQILRDADADLRSSTRPVELVGSWESIKKAEKLIKDVIAEADAGGSPSLVARGFSAVQAASGGEQLEMGVPVDKVGLVIGKGGETIRNLQTRSGARIQLLQQSPSDGDLSKEKTVRVTGTRKQIEIAKEMIEDVMNQNLRPSPLAGSYNQPAYRSRGSGAPFWGPRGPHPSQYPGYDFPQRGPYSSQYPPPSYGNYPPPQAPRGTFGPGWDHRPRPHAPFYQGNYNYGHQQGPDYGAPPHYPHAASQPYGHGYSDAKYDYHASSQQFGPMGSQPAPYAQVGAHSGYGPPDQYGRPPMYNMQPQGPHSHSYGQPRPGQPGELQYSGPGASAQPYSHAVLSQQPYPYTSGAMQQTYPVYGSSMPSDGYGNAPSTAPVSSYPQSGQQPVGGYGSAVAQQAPMSYPQAATAGLYGSYSAGQSGYGDQAAATTAAYGGYQATAAPPYTGTQVATSYPPAAQAATAQMYTGAQAAASYPSAAQAGASYPSAAQAATASAYTATSYPSAAAPAAAAPQSGYAQAPQPQLPSYDQSGGYGNVAAPSGTAKTSDATVTYPQYDSSQMYGPSR